MAFVKALDDKFPLLGFLSEAQRMVAPKHEPDSRPARPLPIPKIRKLKIDGNLREFIDNLLLSEESDLRDIASIPGTNVLDWRDFPSDLKVDYDSVGFVFGTRHDIPWGQKGDEPYWNGAENGYREVESPKTWDLAVYFVDNAPQHMGIITEAGEQLVLSKWVSGPVMEHPLMTIPGFWGEPRFFRAEA